MEEIFLVGRGRNLVLRLLGQKGPKYGFLIFFLMCGPKFVFIFCMKFQSRDGLKLN